MSYRVEWSKGLASLEPTFNVHNLFKQCSGALKRWSKQCAKDRGKEIKEKTECLKTLQVE